MILVIAEGAPNQEGSALPYLYKALYNKFPRTPIVQVMTGPNKNLILPRTLLGPEHATADVPVPEVTRRRGLYVLTLPKTAYMPDYLVPVEDSRPADVVARVIEAQFDFANQPFQQAVLFSQQPALGVDVYTHSISQLMPISFHYGIPTLMFCIPEEAPQSRVETSVFFHLEQLYNDPTIINVPKRPNGLRKCSIAHYSHNNPPSLSMVPRLKRDLTDVAAYSQGNVTITEFPPPHTKVRF